VSTPLTIRILLADDHAVVRAGLRMVLELEPDLRVVAEAADGAEAVRVALSCDGLNLAILDVSMPLLSGLQAARRLREHRPGLRTLMLSMHDADRYLFEALAAGASGYVLKSSADRDLVAACRAVMRGEAFLYPNAVTAIVREQLDGAARGERIVDEPLTPRETEVVKLVAEGLSTKEIAEVLTISHKTVERHRANVLEKLGLRDRVALTRYAIRHGLIEP
jgi:DNA-binding NarL/FixJ family response regulator